MKIIHEEIFQNTGNWIPPDTQSYPEEFIQWCEIKKIKRPNIKTVSGQAWALLINNPNSWYTREDLNKFISKIGLKSLDSIQLVNKTRQKGLGNEVKEFSGITHYNIPHPWIYDSSYIKRKNFKLNNDSNEIINNIKTYLQSSFIDIPNEKWDVGHRDPIGGNGENNKCYQPHSYNRSFRDRFKFDERGLVLNPTVKELKNNPTKYYSIDEWKEILSWFQFFNEL